MKLQPTPTPVITGPSSGGSVSLRPVFGTGPKGDTGDTGPQGIQGDQGDQGPTGDTGDQGLPGPGAAAWTAAQAVTTGSVRQAPDGSWIKSTTNRTTGATFDVTEQGFWTPTFATAGTLEEAALTASIAAQRVGANVARFIQRARAGEDLKVTCVGDSILEGTTVTNPATDGTMKLLATDLATRFPGTVTTTNYAASGFTAIMPFTNGQLASAIAEKAALYIVSAFDKNDLSAELNSPSTGGLYTPGYPQAASLRSVERIVRAIRKEVPEADIIILATNPYAVAETVANAAQDSKDDAVQRIATMYGCEFVDANTPFRDLGDWSALMNDSTHPNTAGHRLIADTILTHLVDQGRTPLSPSSGPVKGVYSPEKVKESVGTYGVSVSLVTGTNLNGVGWSWTNVGAGWSGTGGADPYTTSTTNDYAEFVIPSGAELQLYMSTADADDPVCTITVDTVDVATGQHFNVGKKGVYYVPIAVGLSNVGTRTIRVKRTGGTLKIQRAAVILGTTVTPFIPEARVVTLGTSGSSTAINTGGSFTEHVNTTLTLPTGWAAAVVTFHGYCNDRVTPSSATVREFNTQLLIGSTTLVNGIDTIPIVASSSYSQVGINAACEITASQTVKLQTRLLSTDKTNCYVSGFDLYAVLHRTA